MNLNSTSVDLFNMILEHAAKNHYNVRLQSGSLIVDGKLGHFKRGGEITFTMHEHGRQCTGFTTSNILDMRLSEGTDGNPCMSIKLSR